MNRKELYRLLSMIVLGVIALGLIGLGKGLG